jgi:hypothetical protein
MATLDYILPRIQAPRTRKPRGDCKYTREEIAILNKYKAQYMKTTTYADRDVLLRTKICVDLFNYWIDKGVHIEEEEVDGRMEVSMDTHIIYLNSNNYRKFVHGSETIGGHTGQRMPRHQQGRHLTWTWFGMDGKTRCSVKLGPF